MVKSNTVNISVNAPTLSNVKLEALKSSGTTHDKFPFRITAKDSAGNPMSGIFFWVRVDGKNLSSSSLEGSTDSNGQMTFELQFASAGSPQVQVYNMNEGIESNTVTVSVVKAKTVQMALYETDGGYVYDPVHETKVTELIVGKRYEIHCPAWNRIYGGRFVISLPCRARPSQNNSGMYTMDVVPYEQDGYPRITDLISAYQMNDKYSAVYGFPVNVAMSMTTTKADDRHTKVADLYIREIPYPQTGVFLLEQRKIRVYKKLQPDVIYDALYVRLHSRSHTMRWAESIWEWYDTSLETWKNHGTEVCSPLVDQVRHYIFAETTLYRWYEEGDDRNWIIDADTGQVYHNLDDDGNTIEPIDENQRSINIRFEALTTRYPEYRYFITYGTTQNIGPEVRVKLSDHA